MTVTTHIPDDTATWAAGLLGYRAAPRPATEPPTAFVFTRPTWQAAAACRAAGVAQWFPELGKSAAKARTACHGCPVQAECLQYALDNPGMASDGVWGARTQRELAALRRKAARLAAGEAA